MGNWYKNRLELREFYQVNPHPIIKFLIIYLGIQILDCIRGVIYFHSKFDREELSLRVMVSATE